MSIESLIGEFIDDELLDSSEDIPWKSEFRGSSLPVCQRQLMLSRFYKDEIVIKKPFVQDYNFEVGRAVHRLVQSKFAKRSLLWGDWQCLARETCGAFFQDRILEKGLCIRCGHEAEYVEKTLKHQESEFSGHCDGAIWVKALRGFLALELKSRNHNIIKDRTGEPPYDSDYYQVSAYATLLKRNFHLDIVGRLILWVGKPKPKPRLFWFYPGCGEVLFDAQVREYNESKSLVAAGKVEMVPGVCETMSDIGSCPFGAICFSPQRDQLIREKYEDWKRII